MIDATHLFFFTLTMALATITTRAAPFFLPAGVTRSSFAQKANRILPGSILTLLVIYSIKDTAFRDSPYGLPEVLSIGLVLGIHIWRRNALLSIAVGTAAYMLFKQIVFGTFP
jgi:branched-subunit amino acid transport protein AzlD